MRETDQSIPGFREDIHPGVWHRHMLWGVPQKWVYAWTAICGYGAAYLLYRQQLPLLVPLAGLWVLGRAGMACLTRWDPQWDDVLLASWKVRRYKQRYRAG
jgi:hypothetical protein